MEVKQETKTTYGWIQKTAKSIPSIEQLVDLFLEAKSENKSCAVVKGNTVIVYDDYYASRPQKDSRMVYTLTASELIKFKMLIA